MLFRPVNLAIVDDHTLFRKTLKSYLSDQNNLKVSIQASDILDLLNKWNGSSVDIILMDLYMPGMNGNEAVKMIRARSPVVKILVMSISTDMEIISELLDSGIHGYISKSDEPEQLLQAIQAASDNKIYRNQVFTEALYWNKQVSLKAEGEDSSAVLSDREKRVLQLIWEEKSNKEMADELFLGVRSVEKIRQDLKEKIGAKSTIGMLKFAIRQKIIDGHYLQFSRQSNPAVDDGGGYKL